MNLRMRKIAALCAFAALCVCKAAQAANVRAWLDRNQMQLGETVTLNVQVEGDAQARQPDFGALAGNFDMGLPDALHTAGTGVLLALARQGMGPADLAWYALGTSLAAWLAWRRITPPR